MRLVPRSLFGRLVAVMLAGLVAAQLAGFAIHMRERTELLAQASGMQSAQRIADIVRLMDTLGAAERIRLAAVLSTPPMTIRLGEPAVPAGAGGDDRGARAALFGALLERALGDGRPVEVAVTSAAPFPGPMRAMGPGMGPGMGYGAQFGGPHGMNAFPRPGLAFVAWLRLRDGTPVAFDSRQALPPDDWPYRMLASLAVLLASVIAVSLLAVRWATRPLAALADAAEALGRDIERPPLAEKGPLEVARAARAFNTMQSRLARDMRERTRVLAAMSHDLKTPITRLRLRADLLEDAPLRAKLAADLAQMESMVGATLDFLRGSERAEAVQPIDVNALLESLAADWSETGARVTFAGAPVRPFPGRPKALRRCLSNLIENAVKYGGSAALSAEDGDARLAIRVRDEGPGIPEAELERVFEPYHRLEGSRSRETGGTGLGLAIARAGARAHDGEIRLRNRPEGGLEAELTLPRFLY
jgi:signal transduction histidine kinase